jgi:hypothetical protein
VRIGFERAGRDSVVEVEVAVNDDPEQLGCPGYADFLGWVQLVGSDLHPGGFHLDYFGPLGFVAHPFAVYGFAPEFFDAPHTDLPGWHFLAHCFLCGLGDDTLDGNNEIDALLGFSWGFRRRAGEVATSGPTQLDPGDWDRHRDHLRETYPKWAFRPGFSGAAAGR